MTRAKKLINDIEEGMHHKTKVKEMLHGGSKQIRQTLEGVHNKMREMMDYSNKNTPFPASQHDYEIGDKAMKTLDECIGMVKSMKETMNSDMYRDYGSSMGSDSLVAGDPVKRYPDAVDLDDEN